MKKKRNTKYENIFWIHSVNHTLKLDGTMDNNMVKRYPCRNYECLLAAKALPMTDEFTIKADLEKFSVLSL